MDDPQPDAPSSPAPVPGELADEPLPALSDPRILDILTAEHASLVASRSLAYNETFVRTGMFLTALSAALVALGFVAQALAFGEGSHLFAVLVLALVFVLGLTTLVRVNEAGAEDLLAVQGMNRLRHAYFEMCPEVVPYFSTTDRDDLAGILSSYQGPPGEDVWGPSQVVHGLGTAVGMVGLMLSLVGGALAGLIAALFDLPLAVDIMVGVIACLLILVVGMVVTVRSITGFEARLAPRFPSPAEPERG